MKQKAKGNREKNIACVKCYNYQKRKPFAQNRPHTIEVPSLTKAPKIYVYSHAFVVNSLP